MEVTRIPANIEVPVRTALGTGRIMLVLAEQQTAVWRFITRHWPIGVSDGVLRDPVCRGYPMFHETITFYSNKNNPVANSVGTKATADNGPRLSMVVPSGRTDGKQGCRA